MRGGGARCWAQERGVLSVVQAMPLPDALTHLLPILHEWFRRLPCLPAAGMAPLTTLWRLPWLCQAV